LTTASWVFPTALGGLALLVRVIRWLQTAVMMNDGPEFIRLAQALAAGDWRTVLGHPYHPLYPLAVTVAHGLIPDWERAAVTVSILAGTAAVVALYFLLQEAFDRRIAAIGGFLLAVQPTALELADVQSDSLYLALFVASAAALMGALLHERRSSAAWAGVFAGLAYLTRPEGVGTVLVGVGLLKLDVLRRHLSVSRSMRLMLPLCLTAGAIMAPYVVYISIQAGRPTLTAKKSVTHMMGVSEVEARPETRGPDPLLAAHPELTPLPKGVRVFRDAEPPPEGSANLLFAARQVVSESAKALRPEGVLLLVLGLFAVRGSLSRRGEVLAAYTALYLVVFFGLAATSDYLSRRHVLPAATLLFGYEAIGVTVLAGALGRLQRPALQTAIPLALVAALGLGKALRPDRLDALPERQAAEWIRDQGHLEQGQAIASIKRRVGYYANAPFVDLRRTPHPALVLEFLRRERVRYVIVDPKERDELMRLTAAEPSAFTLRQSEGKGKDEAFVYELGS
jgi:dolichyl-phosphate-mannose-protein mannosyltransferase